MLRDEHRVAAHRRLLAVVARLRRRQPLRDEVAGMREHHRQALVPQVGLLARTQAKALAKGRAPQGGEQLVEVPHPRMVSSPCVQLMNVKR